MTPPAVSAGHGEQPPTAQPVVALTNCTADGPADPGGVCAVHVVPPLLVAKTTPFPPLPIGLPTAQPLVASLKDTPVKRTPLLVGGVCCCQVPPPLVVTRMMAEG